VNCWTLLSRQAVDDVTASSMSEESYWLLQAHQILARPWWKEEHNSVDASDLIIIIIIIIGR
jgi:hypothetical protein